MVCEFKIVALETFHELLKNILIYFFDILKKLLKNKIKNKLFRNDAIKSMIKYTMYNKYDLCILIQIIFLAYYSFIIRVEWG